MTDEAFAFTTTYEGDTDTYYAQRTQYGYNVIVRYKNCEASVEFSLSDVVDKIRQGEWKFVFD